MRLAKTIRILVLPNITFHKDLEKDSYVQVLRNMILGLRREPIFWYILSPGDEPIERLDKPWTRQLEWPVPKQPPVMRSHFDALLIEEYLKDSRLDIDLIFSHLPEQTQQLQATIWNGTHHTPEVIGYAHWFDLKGTASWPKTSFDQNILGVLTMQKCYVNTTEQKRLVIEQARETFAPSVIRRLRKILTVQHLGIFNSQIKDPQPDPDKVIVFPHRPATYKDYPHFLEITDELWKQRNDFKVWVPLSQGKADRPYISTGNYEKENYYEKLRNCCVGFSPKQTYAGWSVATMDGLMNACPFVMHDADYYRELNPTADFFSTKDEAEDLLNLYLSNPEHRMEMIRKGQQHLREHLWEDEMLRMGGDIHGIMKAYHQTHSAITDKLIARIKQEGCITKKDLWKTLKWGRSRKWTSYRRALLAHPHIYDTMDEFHTNNWSEEAR